MGQQALTEKERKEVRDLPKNLIVVYATVVFAVIMLGLVYYSHHILMTMIAGSGKDFIELSMEELKNLIEIMFYALAGSLVVLMAYCVILAVFLKKFKTILDKVMNGNNSTGA